MNASSCRLVAVAATWTTLLLAQDARAFRMIQSAALGRSTSGSRVRCDDPGGFAHRTQSSNEWRLNLANQGGEPGVPAALQSALAAWTDVTPASYQLSYGGTTSAGFETDGVNTVLWASGNGCTGGCLALTALVLGPGQVINESDVSFNNDFNWNTSGGDYDVQAIATHELGHCMGIHHTEITKPRNRPTMYASYFGIEGRTLESDDRDALNCASSRYPPSATAPPTLAVDGSPPAAPGVKLASRVRAGHATLRFAMKEPGPVRLDVFDVAGRRMTSLVSGTKGAGEYEVAWDGETRSGAARTGVYFARIETPEGRGAATIFIAH